ncbi:MAG TPA: single-stranded DNA-binding protein [bacterium]|uniref:Single-stranded DNA-binding protein n=1 Tax=candidate division TA06 bacterium ADurb.Bin417 TaxID=1852828 RepID=A0A1V5MJX8_UNCT6|nr:MAG: Single-stranded DNA-binding protein ssb [candidate division TA06 bacterium ADurb.Bin417]HNQ34505.1 single-stranded DNA-binding protein [bacterium]HNS48049.1 single-stranded DNA-binding protein [bacterium]
MSVNINKVFLAGNLTRDPEMRFIPSGTAVATLRLAVNRSYTGRDGNRKDEVAYVTVVVWGKQAQVCQEHLKKGSSVMIEGRLQSRSWETEEKEKRSAMEVVAERVHFLGGRRTGPGGEGSESSNTTTEEGEFEYDSA